MLWAGKMVQRVKGLAAKPDGLSYIPRARMVEKIDNH